MKKITLFIALLLIGVSAMSQQVEKVTISKSELTVDQLKKLEEQELTKKLENYGNWVGIGGEIGTAVRESLLGVVDVADKFGQTDVGKFTLVMVAWKIIGKDIVRISLGIIFIILFNIIFWRNYSHTFVTQKIRKTGHWYKFWEPYEFELVPPTRYEGYEGVRFLYIAVYIISFWIGYALMFA